MIVFNKPYLSGREIEYMREAIAKQSSGNGYFTKKCHNFFTEKFGFKKTLLTTSCTDALEMAAILLDLKMGDEVILPSFTFVSTANAFILRGAKVVFADSSPLHPNIDLETIESLITPRTRAIVVVHYGGVSVDMDKVMYLSEKYSIAVIEDAAQAVGAYYNGKPLGGIGHLGCFSFHETKNIISGEGGMLVINDEKFIKRSEIIWEKGTNRSAFIRGEVDKYSWVDIGSSFLPSDITAAFLYAQLEDFELIQSKRINLWNKYYSLILEKMAGLDIKLPAIPDYAFHNGHIFYILCASLSQRDFLIGELKKIQIHVSFHYPPLHLSMHYLQFNKPLSLPNATKFHNTLLRLPLYVDLTIENQDFVIEKLIDLLQNSQKRVL